jgi:hypothetical protein
LTMKKKNQSPKDVFKTFLRALQTGDMEAAKSTFSTNSLQLVETISVTQNKTFDEALSTLGFHFLEVIPKIRRENIQGNLAFIQFKGVNAVEVKGLVFIIENDSWKLAFDYDAIVIESGFEKFFNYLKTIIGNCIRTIKNEISGTKAKS